MKHAIRLIGSLTAGFLLTSQPSLSLAQSTGGIAVTPPTFEVSGQPSEQINNTVRVENLNDYPVKVNVSLRNFTAIGEEGAVGLTEEETGFSLASWVNVEPTDVTINPRSSHAFRATINIPAHAEPGGHFGSLVFSTESSDQLEGSGATVAQEIGSLILLKIAGQTNEAASIDSFRTTTNFYEYGPITFETRVQNAGNVHLKPTGTITITNLLGQKVATIPLENKNVLPGALRRLDSTWDTKWRFGRYTATVVIIYGTDQVSRAAITNFVVLPYKLTALAGFIVAVTAIGLYRSRKRLRLAARILFTGKP